MPVFFAYDGSINNDWVARYAIRLASRNEDSALHLYHVDDGAIAADTLREKITRIELESSLMGVSFQYTPLPAGGDIAACLKQEVPCGPDRILICGVRVKSHKKGYLSGTISEKLMKLGLWNVIALRIVQPGLLGLPGNILMPVSGKEEGFHAGLPLLRSLTPDIRSLHLLRVVTLSRNRYRSLTQEAAARLRQEGAGYLEGIENKLLAAIDLDPKKIEVIVRISDDWVKEILICAGRYKSGLIVMEVPRKSLTGRFFFGDKTEELLRDTPCDMALYRRRP